MLRSSARQTASLQRALRARLTSSNALLVMVLTALLSFGAACGGGGGTSAPADTANAGTNSGTTGTNNASTGTNNATSTTNNSTTSTNNATTSTNNATTSTNNASTGTNNATTSNPGALCDPCTTNEECGGEGDLCVNLPNEGGGVCTQACDDASPCPETYTCTVVQEVPLVQQCVPETFYCGDRCAEVDCADGQICDPISGDCIEPLGLCDLGCLVGVDADADLCGGPEDRCLYLSDTDERICTIDCRDAPDSCPEGYFCATLGEAPDQDFQCVPEALTCVDRCSDAVCAPGTACDPISGDCVETLGLCDVDCTSNALCGDGPEDICLSTGAGDGEEAFCALGCEDSFDCPLNYFCAQLVGRETGACVPLELTCVDRCEDVACPEGSNCDPFDGSCVPSEVGLCEPCGELSSASCGGQDDLCLSLGEEEGVVCTQDCSDDVDSCPQGYTCQILSNTTRRACIPSVGECRRCAGVECPEGATCDPGTGECVTPATVCPDVPCGAGDICNPDTGACEQIGEACTFDTRLQDCFGPVRRCTATRTGSDGTCAVICREDDDCSPEAPNCVDLFRVGRLCVPDGLGGPSTCGVSAPADASLGKPCGAGLSGGCEADMPLCIEGVESDTPGFCSRDCDSDEACGEGGSCQTIRGREGRYCVPSNCLCLTGAAVPDGVTDLVAEALGQLDLTRCSFTLDPTQQALLGPETPGAPLKTPGVAGLVAQPLSAPNTADALLDALVDAQGSQAPVRDVLIQTASRQALRLEARSPVSSLPDDLPPLAAGLRRFAEASGGAWDPGAVEGDLSAVGPDAQAALGSILEGMAEVVEVRRGIADALGLDDEAVGRLFAAAPTLTLRAADGAPTLDPRDAATLEQLEGFDRAALAQAAADLIARIEAADLPALLDGATFSIRYATPAGWIILGNAGDTVYDPDVDPVYGEPVALLLDVSGDDTYLGNTGANIAASQPVSVAIDLQGQDAWGYTPTADPADQDAWLPSDTAGRYVPTQSPLQGDGAVSLSDTARQGAGRLGVGVLMDLGGAGDTYAGLRMSQGAGVLGVGVLYDDGGADAYSVEAMGQGAGVLGLGVLIDGGGNDADPDTFRAWHAAQGFGGPLGAGLLHDLDGRSEYTAEPGQGPADVLYFALADRSLSNTNYAQGAGAGQLPSETRAALGGGVGLLVDLGGDDAYTAAVHAQGAGVHLGAGVLIDRAGDDTYVARYGAQGAGERVAVGLLLDAQGSDRYNADAPRAVGTIAGAGRDFGAGVLLDREGDDVYALPNASGGAALLNGVGVMIDLGGADTYTAQTANTLGSAASGVVGDDDPRQAAPTLGLFIDAGDAQDAYSRFDIDADNPLGIGDDSAWQQSADDADNNAQGVGIDGAGGTGLEAP